VLILNEFIDQFCEEANYYVRINEFSSLVKFLDES